jgi:hypothetical protein
MSDADQPRITAGSTADRSKITGRSPAGFKSAITRSPAGRLDGRSPTGKRVRDLFQAVMARLNQPADVIVQADALAWAELKSASEVARARLLEGDTKSSNEIVRLENLTRRAAISVGLESAVGEAPLSISDRLAALGYAPPSDDDDETDVDDGEGTS